MRAFPCAIGEWLVDGVRLQGVHRGCVSSLEASATLRWSSVIVETTVAVHSVDCDVVGFIGLRCEHAS
jgi:hypothetical protein